MSELSADASGFIGSPTCHMAVIQGTPSWSWGEHAMDTGDGNRTEFDGSLIANFTLSVIRFQLWTLF
ncbi:hypothetical protein LOC71_09930 [Rhodopirellula sp. JC740]|uniref:Uncharacterized protein n=1 Tax=Rhodopirellula halodulae TaxID=2894198 RepID=A0ABS8NGD0_9BACT|nr:MULTISPECIES: hypothetical protein [unclassified Rhodopirellula]MCC9642593.1 hypothetical protein [Rhodopirellula sp. JC740]MCC9655966.1 hypothetical protein [Rhodopirellula sp. JC737]